LKPIRAERYSIYWIVVAVQRRTNFADLWIAEPLSRCTISWKSIGDLTAVNNLDTSRRSEHFSELKIYDFFRPSNYKIPMDLLMLVGNTVVPLGDVGQCAVGWALLQNLFSEEDGFGK
jgi:hypothetical protein